jgi:tripartite ATP-independent transporter DctM subunit
MNEITVGLLNMGILLVLFLSGIELGLAIAIMGFLGFAYLVSLPAAFNLIAKDFFDCFSSYGFTVIPLFIFMGQIAYHSGIAKQLFDTAHKFVGHIPGGLAIATVAGATLFKAICGSSPATAATFASIAVPEMDRYGYDRKISTGIVATVGTLGVLIPPSVTLIIFGVITEQSIGRLFIAGLIPGLLIALFFIFVIVGWARINPVIAPRSEKFPWDERWKSLPAIIWPVLIFLVVIGGLLNGFFTPSEAGSIGTASVLVLALTKKSLSWKAFAHAVEESVRTACMVILIIAGSQVFGHFIAITDIPSIAGEWISSLPLNRYLIMFIISLFYLIGGSFIDDLAFMILATPIFYPTVLKLSFSPIWFGVVIAITVMIGVVIPPVAMNVFVVKNITKTPFSVIYSGVYPFLLSLAFGGVLVFIFPQLATWLPDVLYK